jgi:hypothetical protein
VVGESVFSSCLSLSLSLSLWLYNSLHLDRFFSFLIYTQPVGLLGRGISPSQGRYLHIEQHNTKWTHTDIHASSGFRTHDPSVRAGRDGSRLLRLCGHSDRRLLDGGITTRATHTTSFFIAKENIWHCTGEYSARHQLRFYDSTWVFFLFLPSKCNVLPYFTACFGLSSPLHMYKCCGQGLCCSL